MPLRVFCLLLAVVTLTLAAGLVYEVGQNRDQATVIAELRREAKVRLSAVREQESTIAGLQQQRETLTTRAAHAEKSVASLRKRQAMAEDAPPEVAPAPAAVAAAVTTSAHPATTPDSSIKPLGKGGAMSKLLSTMLKDPAMKDMMRTQQGTAMRMMYGDLVKQWALSPDEADTFYGLLIDKQMAQIDASQALMQNDGGGERSTVANTSKQYEARLKTSLGDDLYKQYQDYEKTLADRMVLNQFQQQVSGSGAPAITAEQSSAVLQVMTEERQAQPVSADATSGLANGGVMDQKAIDAFTKSQGEINDRVDQRLAATLSAAQLDALKAYQKQMLAVQTMGMTMAAKMMGDGKTGP